MKQQLVDGLKAEGIKFRIKDLGRSHRIVLTDSERKLVGATVERVCNDLGYTGASGKPLEWSCWNGRYELNAYKPGMVVYV